VRETQEENGELEFLGIHVVKEDEGLWITHDESANVDALSDFIGDWLLGPDTLTDTALPDRPAYVGFEFSHDCSRPMLDAYGGGAVFITASGSEWTNSFSWLNKLKHESGFIG
jgi:hypothetical protein